MQSYSISKAHILSSSFSPPIQKNNLLKRNYIKLKRKSYICLVAIDIANPPRRPRILVAGGGIGGLVFAIAAKKKGFDVVVLERDSSVVKGEGKFRGPIMLESNALSTLEAIDKKVADQVMNAGCIIGNRVNGIVDGLSGSWFAKFDTFSPACERGQPVARVISRISLQEILACALGDDTILNNSHVVNFVDRGNKVNVMLENGQQLEGDLLVGAGGISSKVRKILFGPKDSTYSGYTCYTGIADYVPPDIGTVGFRVFLGHKKYFVSCDVGAGKMQWYAFNNEPAWGTDSKNGKKERLLHLFGDWCYSVGHLITATNEEMILRRDIFDHVPTMTWGKGRVTLLGDSIHAMQPNLGQGGCMAIEDGYQLARELDKACIESSESDTAIDIVSSLKRYEEQRRIRVAIIHGIARLTTNMASIYRSSLEFGTCSLLSSIWRIGFVSGRFLLKIVVPPVVNWIVTGNSTNLEGRTLCCQLSDKASYQFKSWFEDDDALEQAINGEYGTSRGERKFTSLSNHKKTMLDWADLGRNTFEKDLNKN